MNASSKACRCGVFGIRPIGLKLVLSWTFWLVWRDLFTPRVVSQGGEGGIVRREVGGDHERKGLDSMDLMNSRRCASN